MRILTKICLISSEDERLTELRIPVAGGDGPHTLLAAQSAFLGHGACPAETAVTTGRRLRVRRDRQTVAAVPVTCLSSAGGHESVPARARDLAILRTRLRPGPRAGGEPEPRQQCRGCRPWPCLLEFRVRLGGPQRADGVTVADAISGWNPDLRRRLATARRSQRSPARPAAARNSVPARARARGPTLTQPGPGEAGPRRRGCWRRRPHRLGPRG